MEQLWGTNRLGVIALGLTSFGVIATLIIPSMSFAALLAGLVVGIISLTEKHEPTWLGWTSVIVSGIAIIINSLIASFWSISAFLWIALLFIQFAIAYS